MTLSTFGLLSSTAVLFGAGFCCTGTAGAVIVGSSTRRSIRADLQSDPAGSSSGGVDVAISTSELEALQHVSPIPLSRTSADYQQHHHRH
jgi:hypothetical protein